MKHRYRLRDWSITRRLVVVATVPLLLMFIALAIAVYVTGRQDVIDGVTAHGEVLAQALAETSRYGVVSGNTEALEKSVRRFIDTDKAIATIQVLDERHRAIVTMGSSQAQPGLVFERPIASDVPEVDTFAGSSPSASVLGGTMGFKAGTPAGFVRVAMSAKPVLDAQRRRLYFAVLGMIAAGALAGMVGLYLARRLIRRPLSAVMEALREIRQGHLAISFDHRMSGEIGELQVAIEDMAKGLSVTRHDLENLVRTRTEELHQAVAARQALIARDNDLLEDERRGIALDLHDQFNASLLPLRFVASSLLPKAGRTLSQEDVAAAAITISQGLKQLYADTRRLIQRLRPEILDTLGLGGAITEAVRLFNENQDECSMALVLDENIPRLPQKISIAAYRAVQEAMSNILKHAQATRARVAIRHRVDAMQVEIEVRDNGVGFDIDPRKPGYGLLGMRERVESTGGEFLLKSLPSRGTKLIMRFPLTFA